MKIKQTPGSIYQEYMNDIDWKTAIGFVRKWPEFSRFIEGNQWPAPTEETKYMPRPVINICDQTVENKTSNILSQQLKMQFRVKELPEDATEVNEIAQDFTDMAESTWYETLQDTLTEDMVRDTVSLGTGILHYYFDNNYNGGTYTKYIGKICGEDIDPMDLILGNNQLKPYQFQKQPFVTIRRRKDVNEVVEQAKKTGEDWELIQPSKSVDTTEKYDNARVESRNTSEVETFTKYFRENGELYWVEVTKEATVVKKTMYKPDLKGLEDVKFTLYPVVMNVFKYKRKCAYGRSMIEDIIPNQKALNWGLGMQLLSVQQTAWPKIIAKVGALAQTITNVPGEVITDQYQGGGGDGVKYMQMPNTPATASVLTQNIMDMTRNVVGVSEVSTGESIGANMAASAIIALQNQAQKPNDAYMRIVVETVKRIGEIWEEFYKCFYNTPRPIKGKDDRGKPVTKMFEGEKGRGVEFDLMVDVGPSSMFSESLQISVLDNYADRQWIDKFTHASNMPTAVLPQAIREQFEKEKEQAEEQAELQQLMQQQAAEQKAIIDQQTATQPMGGIPPMEGQMPPPIMG